MKVWSCGREHPSMIIDTEVLARLLGIEEKDVVINCECGLPAIKYEEYLKILKEKRID